METTMPYVIDYEPTDAESESVSDNRNPRRPDRREQPVARRRFVVPSIVKTTSIFLFGAAAVQGGDKPGHWSAGDLLSAAV
ncbi:hypothetical protein [Sphingomonas koreensis]|uniref:hypothetical protein n=3 Tax=Sphingomonas koreensis TaxID=93064 RepID=UPI000F7F8EC5|nr:hypothetical protein [Sphingomonas koreensis]